MSADKGVILSLSCKTKCAKISVKTLSQSYSCANLICAHCNLKKFDNTILPQQVSKWISFLPQWIQQVGTFQPSCRLKSSWIRRNSFLFFILILLCTFLPQTTANRFNRASPTRTRNRGGTGDYRRRPGAQCERITIPTCIDIGYNFTDISLSPSNMFKQEEVASTVKQFSQVFEVACAEEMKQLVCAIYAPICMETYSKFLPPCRHICERAKKGCGPILEKYQVPWPELLRCENFPPFSGENQPCLHFNRTSIDEIPTSSSQTLRLTKIPNVYKTETWTPKSTETLRQNYSTPTASNQQEDQCNCHCHHTMIPLTDPNDPLYGKVAVGRTPNCVIPCRSLYFTRDELSMLQSCITALAVVCFIVTSLTVGTFLIDTSRFNYPERTIIFLSLCYMFVSMGFLIRIAAGHDAVACGWRSDRVLYSTATVSFLCGLVYFLLYYFGMAGAVWWVILSFTWLLASGLKWGSEAISSYSQAFHLIAWIIPAIQTIVVFALGSVDGDAVSGICFVGNQNINNAYHLVVLPLLLYVSLGSIFSLFGFFDLCRIRTSITKAKKKPPGFDKMISRMGFFSLTYVVFSVIFLICYFYELLNRNKWANAKNCRKSTSGATCLLDNGATPDVSIFTAKYSMILLIGITNAIWICSQKTVHSWKRFYQQSFVFICGSDGFVSWFKKKRKKGSSKASQSESTTARVSEQTSIEVLPESSVSGVDPPKQGSASTLNESVDNSSRQDGTILCEHRNSGGSSFSREHHRKHVKRRDRSSCGCNSREAYSSLGSKRNNEECRIHLLSCELEYELSKVEKSADLKPEFSRLTSVPSVHRNSRSSTDKDSYILHFPSKCLCNSSKQCVVYCRHPVGVSSPIDRSSPSPMKIGSDGRIQHIHHHHHHLTESGAFLPRTHQQSCPIKNRNHSQSCTSSGMNRHSQTFCVERNSFHSNSLHR